MPATDRSSSSSAPRRFGRRHRLGGRAAFAAVYQARVFKSAGPLTLHSRPNGLGYHRLGLSVGRRVGKAVTRNLIKRRLREAFRLRHREWPPGGPGPGAAGDGGAAGEGEQEERGGYDLVVGVRPHPRPLPMAEYAELLGQMVRQADAVWRRRGGGGGGAREPGGGDG